MRLAVVCDRGGHLHNALMLIQQLDERPDLLVVTPGPEVVSLQKAFPRVVCLPYLFSWIGKRRVLNPFKAFWHTLVALTHVLRYRPKTVISLGASDVVAFCVLAKWFGARLIHVECMNQVTSPSVTGRVLYRFCDQLEVQWPDLLPVYGAKASYRGWVLPRPERNASSRPHSSRPKVFVAVSTGHFEALIEACEKLKDRYEFTAQIGSGVFEPSFEFMRTLRPEELQRRIDAADLVVTHAGTGMLSMVYRSGKCGVVIPKQIRYGEANDGQVELARKWAELQLGVLCMDVNQLDSALQKVAEQSFRDPQIAELGKALRGNSLPGSGGLNVSHSR